MDIQQQLQNATYELIVEIILEIFLVHVRFYQSSYIMCFGEHLSFLYNIDDNVCMNTVAYKNIHANSPIIYIDFYEKSDQQPLGKFDVFINDIVELIKKKD